MTTIMNQVISTLCEIKIDESKWKENIMSTNHSQFCKEDKDEIAIRFFEMIFSTYHNRSEIYDLKNKKALDFWQSFFKTKVPKEKLDTSCDDWNNNSKLEASLTSELLDFIKNCTYYIGKSCFDSLDKITTFCRNFNNEVHKSLLYDHFKSKGHRDT